MNNQTINLLKAVSIFSLVAYPTLLIVSFAMHFTSLSDFFVFQLKYVQVPVEKSVTMLMGEQAIRNFVAPHIIAYLAVPFMIFSALSIGIILLREKPILAIMTTLFTIIGALFLGGVFSAWLSFSAIGNMPNEMYDAAVIAFKELTTMQGPLLLFSSLSVLSILCFLIFAFCLFRSNIVPKWSAILLFLGHLIILLFMDLDNWMLIGAVLILIGIHPIISVIKRSEKIIE